MEAGSCPDWLWQIHHSWISVWEGEDAGNRPHHFMSQLHEEEGDFGGRASISDQKTLNQRNGNKYLKCLKYATAVAFSSERIFNIWVIFHHPNLPSTSDI